MLRALQHHAHEDEQRDRQQHLVGHHAEDALRQRAEDARNSSRRARGRARAKAATRRRASAPPDSRPSARAMTAATISTARSSGSGISAVRVTAALVAENRRARIACATPCSAISTANSRDQRLEQEHQRQAARLPASARGSPRSARHRAAHSHSSSSMNGSSSSSAPARSISAARARRRPRRRRCRPAHGRRPPASRPPPAGTARHGRRSPSRSARSSRAESIARHHQRELQQHDDDHQPRRRAADGAGQAVDAVGELAHCGGNGHCSR